MWLVCGALELEQNYSRLSYSKSGGHGQGKPKLQKKIREHTCFREEDTHVLGSFLPLGEKIPSFWGSPEMRLFGR